MVRIKMRPVVALALILMCSTLYAQYPDVEATPPDGELAVYFVNADEVFNQEDVTVSLMLNGVVYNDIGHYNTSLSSNHPKYGQYSTDNLYGTSYSLKAIETPDMAEWESAYYGTGDAEAATCIGAVGWGDYKLQVQIGSRIEYLYINTIDGNWMQSANGIYNKIAIALNFVDLGNESPDVIFHIWDWQSHEWDLFDDGDVFFVHTLYGSSRNTASLDAISTGREFYWEGNVAAPLVIDDAIVDHNIGAPLKTVIARC